MNKSTELCFQHRSHWKIHWIQIIWCRRPHPLTPESWKIRFASVLIYSLGVGWCSKGCSAVPAFSSPRRSFAFSSFLSRCEVLSLSHVGKWLEMVLLWPAKKLLSKSGPPTREVFYFTPGLDWSPILSILEWVALSMDGDFKF